MSPPRTAERAQPTEAFLTVAPVQTTAKRLLDMVAAAIGLVLATPLLALAAIGIRCSSRGPVLFRAARAGRHGRPFVMYKLRTMHVDGLRTQWRVTGVEDPRVFPLGRALRCLKIDELPQLWNVLRGEMSLVGPRPEDLHFVARYAPPHRETLALRPGLLSPGSLYHDTHGDRFLRDGDPEALYLEGLLPIKLAFELFYVRHASLWYDFRIIGRTLGMIAGHLAGRRVFRDPPELVEARRLAVPLHETAAPDRARVRADQGPLAALA